MSSNDVLNKCPEILEYMEMVEHPDPQYPVCEPQKLLMAMVRKVFATEDLTINFQQLAKYLSFQKYFEYDLFAWEKFSFTMHNCLYRTDGLLRFPVLFLFTGRGTGKNGYLSFEDFCLTTPVNGVKNYDIDIGANSESQSRMSFDDIRDVLDNDKPRMSKSFKWTNDYIRNLKTNSEIHYRTSNARTSDGRRPGKVDLDEVHEYDNYDLIDVFVTGLGKKQYPRQTILSTNGYVRDGPLDHYVSRSMEILNGSIPDNGWLPCIWRLDNKEEVHDQRKWHKANPSLRYMPNLLDEMKREYADYQMDQIGNAGFMVKRMNMVQGRTQDEVTSWEHIKACSRDPKSMPKEWAAGIDFAMTTDFVAVLLFGINGYGEWVWLTHTWVCSQCNDLSRIKFPIADAVERGLITWVEDVEIPAELPAHWLAEQMATKKIIGVAIDDFRAALMEKALVAAGFASGKDGNIKHVKGRDIMKIAPGLIAKFAREEIAFGDNPLMRWYINNSKKEIDVRGNITFGKIEPKTRKTDGFMAAVAATTFQDQLELNLAMEDAPFDVMVF